MRSIVSAKIANQRAVLQRALRDHGDEMAAGRPRSDRGRRRSAQACILRRVAIGTTASRRCAARKAKRPISTSPSSTHLIRAADPDIRFRGRSRRPPLDPVNALLSFLYTLLTHDCRSAAESVGLDPAVGFLHRDRPGRPSLALDLMEELRPALADRLALSLINRRQLRARDFETRDGGAVLLTDDRPQDGADRLAGPKEGGAPPSLSRRDRAARPRAVSAGATCSRAICAAISTLIRRGSGNERSGRDAGARDL